MSEILFQPLGQPIAIADALAKTADIDPRLTRTNFFDGRLLTAEDLTREQLYLDQRVREVGRVLGSGIVSGLEVELNASRYLLVKPGVAVTPAGRVLELGDNGTVTRSDGSVDHFGLSVDLGQRALIAGLNDGQFRRFGRGLYAVVLQFAEVGTDIAEVFPRDLGAARGSQYALITEAVQLGLVPMPVPLAQQNELAVRARLMREFLGDSRVRGLIPEDAVALGVLAIEDDSPLWLDRELLRQPVREENLPGDLQGDLSRQYERLLADILAWRGGGNLNGDFHASDYFSLLPPVGTLPTDTIDPVTGRQGFFPENYQVSIAPVRLSDLDLIKAESMSLPPIDLTNGEPVDIVVLAPLANLDYGYFAAQLERSGDAGRREMPQIDLLRLKLYPTLPVHALNTDAAAWQAIWDRLGGASPVYLRRPIRAAETAISAIVLARGTALPAAPEPEAPSPADGGGQAEDEKTVLLRQLNFKTLAETRPPDSDDGNKALEALLAAHGEDADAVQIALHLLLRVERRYDAVVWQTLREAADARQLQAYADGLRSEEFAAGTSTGKIMAELGSRFGLSSQWIDLWAKLAEPELPVE